MMKDIKKFKEEVIEGDRIMLVPFSLKHLNAPEYISWLCDYDTVKFLNLPEYWKPIPFEKVEAYVKSMIASESNLFFAIIAKDEKKCIGTFKIGGIDWNAMNVNLGIMIGDSSYWGKGIASETFSIAIKYCFEQMNMHKIIGGCMEPNIGMRKVFEKCGFKEEGCFIEQDFLEGKWWDHYHYGLLNQEYNKQKSKS